MSLDCGSPISPDVRRLNHHLLLIATLDRLYLFLLVSCRDVRPSGLFLLAAIGRPLSLAFRPMTIACPSGVDVAGTGSGQALPGLAHKASREALPLGWIVVMGPSQSGIEKGSKLHENALKAVRSRRRRRRPPGRA